MLKAIFNKAIEWGLLEKNPVTGIKQHKEQSRDRYITKEEAPRFFQALEEETNQLMKDFVLISLYTGARKSNVLSMRWESISFANKTWYISDTKNGEPQTVVLIDDEPICQR
ncbi:tyrosine-type recombinase/integrase [Candidatus Tisiphia endosymbiont of Nemotelus uliginosus]|uniref:tyrosine-type recombinase/integrase n=1 Tax=Candidatus Tisiphia endosymbiont of Nemotelus uliginosus TaxID=3077926 RepID=UPI0035C9277E